MRMAQYGAAHSTKQQAYAQCREGRNLLSIAPRRTFTTHCKLSATASGYVIKPGTSRLSLFTSTLAPLGSPSGDQWLAVDKFQHVVFCFAVTLTAYFFIRRWAAQYPYGLTAAVCCGVLAGALKEVGDQYGWWPGSLSGKDFVADVLGTLLAAACTMWWEGRRMPKPRSIDLEQGLVYGHQILRNLRTNFSSNATVKSAYRSLRPLLVNNKPQA